MEIQMDPRQKQMLDDVFDAFTILAGGSFVSLMHIKGGYTRYSPAFVDLVGLPGEYVANGAMNWADYVHPEDRKRYLDVMMPLLESGSRSYDLTYRIRTKSGEYIVCRFMGAVIRDRDGEPVLVGGITINQGLMDNTDPVTVLRNRNGFFEDLSALMREDVKPVILLMGLNKLSEINQVYGYSYGNRVLQETAFLMQETIRDRGTLYRMDGAAFAFLTDTVSKQEVSAIYDTIHLKLQRGISVDGIRTILISNGGLISCEDPRMDTHTVYACLNYAYRESKHKRGGELVDFNGSINYDLRTSLEIVNTIRDCILDGCKGFYINYQPMVSARSEKPVGMEALIRWRGEPYGEVEPMNFIPILEKDFVFEELSEWIFRQVMMDGLKFLEKDLSLMMSINLSASQIEDEFFIESLTALLNETGFPPDNLCLEVTKGCRLLEVDKLRKIVTALHKCGIRVVIDDFGTGFESVNFLKILTVDYIKFDRELVGHIEDSVEDRQTLEYLSKLAAVRGASVCVKGVETGGMRDILRKFSVNSMQGNLYSRPRSFDEIMKDFFP